ncbi:MAG: sodium-dependent transporter, partial [Oscillospiraceae bacterium]|nr:sodium-dependent transporter [Oscillospiraceae bacterium]
MSETKNAKFSSRWGFILSAVGSAVGRANVWGFPAKVGANGGGAFLIAYLIFIVLFSIVGLSAEYAIGRRAKTG